MKFGWINIVGAGIVVLILIPNIIYAIKNKGEENLCTNRCMNVIEQIGRYACIVLMWLPLLKWEFGISVVLEMVFYFVGNGILLAAYWAVYARYFHLRTTKSALILAILPSEIFLLSGLLLRHWLLVGFAVLFAIGHIYVISANASANR